MKNYWLFFMVVVLCAGLAVALGFAFGLREQVHKVAFKTGALTHHYDIVITDKLGNVVARKIGDEWTVTDCNKALDVLVENIKHE